MLTARTLLALVAFFVVAVASHRPDRTSTMCVPIPQRTDPSGQVAPATSIFVRTQGRRKNNEPYWFLIPGTSASHNYWRTSAEDLSLDEFVVMVDPRGQGQSNKTFATVPATAANPLKYTYELFAYDFFAVIDALDRDDRKAVPDPIYCAGISIGASICTLMATIRPNQIKVVVLVNGAPLFRCADGSTNGAIPGCNATGNSTVAWLTGVATTPFSMLPEDELSGVEGCNVTLARAKIQQNREVSGVAVASIVAYAQKEDQTPILKNVKARTLVVAGLGDITNGIQAAEAYHRGIVNSVRLDFVNRGHLLPITMGYELAYHMTNFVRGIAMPENTRVLDNRVCEISDLIAPESPFVSC